MGPVQSVGLCVRETKHFIIYILHKTFSLRLIKVTLLHDVGSGALRKPPFSSRHM